MSDKKRKRIFLCSLTLNLMIAAFVCPQLSEASEALLVIADHLTLRTAPKITAPKVGQLKQWQRITASKKTSKSEPIGYRHAHWYYIDTHDTQGWCYGGYLAKQIGQNQKNQVAVYQNISDDDPLQLRFFMFSPQYREKPKIMKRYETMIYFSPSLRYYVDSARQDIWGTITFYETFTDRKLHEERFTGPDPVWKGDTLTFEAVTKILNIHQTDERLETETKIFDNGQVRLTKTPVKS